MQQKKEYRMLAVLFGIVLWIVMMLIAGNYSFYGTTENSLNRLLNAFTEFSQMKFHIRFTNEYIKNYGIFSVIFFGACFCFYINEQKYKHDRSGEEGGSAKFNTDLKSYNRKYADPIGSPKNNGPMNMILSQNVRLSLEDFKTRRNNNILGVGGAGTGKTRFFIKPNILQMNCSYIVTDPSGELLRSLGNLLLDNHYKVKIFNLVNMNYSCCYNPFEYMRDDAGVGILVDCFMQNTNPPDQKSSGDPFWEKSEKALLTACIYYLRDFCSKEDQTFANILMMIQSGDMEENAKEKQSSAMDKLFDGEAIIRNGEIIELFTEKRTRDPNTHAAMTERSYIQGYDEEKVEELKRCLMKEKPLAWKNYQTFRLGAARTLKSILISAAVRLNPFNIPIVANLTKKDTLELDTVGDEKTILFVIIPQANTTYNFLASMMYSQMFDALYYKAEHTKADRANGIEAGRLKFHVRFLMDEFANIGKIPQFPEKISTMRKYNISTTVILQSLAQIKKMYADDYETIIGNCDSTILLGAQEQTTAEYYSKQLGKETIKSRSTGLSKNSKSGGSMNFNQTGRELMTMDEIRTMRNELCLVFVRGENPFRDEKYELTKHPMYKFTGDADETLQYDLSSKTEFLNTPKENLGNDKKDEDLKENEEIMEEHVTAPKDPEELFADKTPEKVYEEIISDKTANIKYKRKLEEYLRRSSEQNTSGIFACYLKNADIYQVEIMTDWTFSALLDRKRPVILMVDDVTHDYTYAYYVDMIPEYDHPESEEKMGIIRENLMKFRYEEHEHIHGRVMRVKIRQLHAEKIEERLNRIEGLSFSRPEYEKGPLFESDVKNEEDVLHIDNENDIRPDKKRNTSKKRSVFSDEERRSPDMVQPEKKKNESWAEGLSRDLGLNKHKSKLKL